MVLDPAVGPSRQSPGDAMPSFPVVSIAPLIAPSPATTANMTGMLARGVPAPSVTFTRGMAVTGNARNPLCSVGVAEVNRGAPARPVAVNTVLIPLPVLAVSWFCPGVEPSVHDPTCACPCASVNAVPPVTVPLFKVTTNVTGTAGTGFVYASTTWTIGVGVIVR